MKGTLLAFFIVIGILPSAALANIRINEIAWMGTAENANSEWVELFNDGAEPVDLTGWKLAEGGGATDIITLGKTIEAQSFLLIERTTPSAPDAISGVSDEAGSFAGGGLNNGGEFLVLKDKSGSIVQSLDFIGGWPAGSAGTKQTMQWNGSAWITALATPKNVNATIDTGTPPNDVSTTTASSTTDLPTYSAGGGGYYSAHDGQEELSDGKNKILPLGAGRPRLALTGVPIEFAPEGSLPAGIYFDWIFGDGSVQSGTKVSHSYAFPGDYQVVLRGYYGYGQEATARTAVKVTAPDLDLLPLRPGDGFIAIVNNSTYETNLSGFVLDCDGKRFAFPHDTIVSAKSDLKIPLAVTKCPPGSTVFALTLGERILARADDTGRAKKLAELGRRLAEVQIAASSLALSGRLETGAIGKSSSEVSAEKPDAITPVNAAAQVIRLEDRSESRPFWLVLKSWFVK
jgi:hypothetical protein